jgi:hypothetical protein
MLLRVPAVPARAEPSAAAFLVGAPPGVELAPSLGAAPVHAPVPSVDELTSQVLDRIERRAIAQRERMGRI